MGGYGRVYGGHIIGVRERKNLILSKVGEI